MYVPSAEIIGCVFTSFLIFSLVEARHKHVTCVEGRQEGDKWFDGCKWCVCQSSGPLCSPAECSDLTRRVPPCTRLGSRWRDGCYECQCHKHGIECHADRACVILMQMEAYQVQVMTPGACVQPKDDRCVCGVDGVPSCTVEVIDRDAHPATTIAFDVSLPYSSKDTLSGAAGDIDPYEEKFDTGRDEEYRYSEVDESDLKRSRPIRKHNKNKEAPSEMDPSYDWTSDVPNDDWSRDLRTGGSLRKISEDLFGSTRQRGHRSSRPDTFEYDRSKQPAASSSHQRRRGVVYGEPFSTYLDGLREESRSHHRRTQRYRRNADRKWRLANVRNSKGQLVHVPGSLLVITDNRCRYGIRWYGGGLRCFCDEEGSVTCGDPSFVATRIDGFRLEKLPCEEGHAWEEHGSCQVCDCQISGVVLCRRSESCPLPFLIRPVTYADENFKSETPNESAEENDDEDTRISKRKPRQKLIDFNLEDKSRNGPSDKTMLEVNNNPGFKLDRVKDPEPDSGRTRNLYHTTVIVRECKPGSRWMDGCKRCSCANGRKQCDDRHCLKPRPPSQSVGSTAQTIRDKINGRPFQRPPSVSVVRERPVSIKSPFSKSNSCEGHKVRQIYWVKCNLCVCTSGGPRCTAKSCG